MDRIFLTLLNRSIAASWLILAVIALRFLLKKAPKWIACLLWALVAVRLVCPVSVESTLSLIPSAEPISTEVFLTEPADFVVSPDEHQPGAPVAGTDCPQAKRVFAPLIWAAGAAAMLLYAVVSTLLLRRGVASAASACSRPAVPACPTAHAT